MNAHAKVIFTVKIVEEAPGRFHATGESDGNKFMWCGDIDTVYHEVENQLDSATTRGGESNGTTDETPERDPRSA